ncbi:MAG: lipocalin family protein, partial [Candidatus Sericytochromatia bacterium]|nr:lipocalin family protein [Candidatus Sericytochromatia bacterium]
QEWQTPGSTGETYWEGSVKASGTRRGKPLGGEGYVELTGYARRFAAPI